MYNFICSHFHEWDTQFSHFIQCSNWKLNLSHFINNECVCLTTKTISSNDKYFNLLIRNGTNFLLCLCLFSVFLHFKTIQKLSLMLNNKQWEIFATKYNCNTITLNGRKAFLHVKLLAETRIKGKITKNLFSKVFLRVERVVWFNDWVNNVNINV